MVFLSERLRGLYESHKIIKPDGDFGYV
jgi:hypothetical protein